SHGEFHLLQPEAFEEKTARRGPPDQSLLRLRNRAGVAGSAPGDDPRSHQWHFHGLSDREPPAAFSELQQAATHLPRQKQRPPPTQERAGSVRLSPARSRSLHCPRICSATWFGL